MNHSMYSADRATHLKIVVVALIGATLVAGIGIAARVTDSAATATARLKTDGPIIKAGQPVIITSNDGSAVR
jgi:hypothetical protein